MFLFFCALSPMLLISRLIPSLVAEEHPRTKWMDGVRGVAAILVSVNHAPLMLINLVILPKVFYFDIDDTKILSFFGAFGVQIFFCITGLLFARKILSSKPLDWTDFFEKRLRRVVPAYFMAALLALALGAWFAWPSALEPSAVIAALPALFGFGFFPMPVINGIEFYRFLGVAWSLAIEWRFYFVLPVIYIAIKKNRNATFGAILLFAVIDLLLNASSSWVFFITGALCSLFVLKDFTGRVRAVATLVAVLAVVFIFYRAGIKPNYGIEQWLSVSVLFAALTISRPRVFARRTLVAMGTVSYSFYLLHVMTLCFVVGAINFYVVDVGTLSFNNYALMLGGALCLASIVSTISYIFIERRFMHKPMSTKSAALQACVEPAKS